MEAVMRPRYSVLSAAWLREGIYHFCIVVEAHVNMNTPLHPLDKHMLAFFASIFRHYSLECPNSPSCLDLNHICALPCICTCNNRMFVASASDFTVSSCNCEPLAWDYNHTLIILTPSQSSSKGTFLFLQRLWDRCWCVWFHLWNLFFYQMPQACSIAILWSFLVTSWLAKIANIHRGLYEQWTLGWLAASNTIQMLLFSWCESRKDGMPVSFENLILIGTWLLLSIP